MRTNLPNQNTVALFLVVEEISLILPAVTVDEQPGPMHLVVLKIASVLAGVRPGVLATPLHFVLDKVAFIA